MTVLFDLPGFLFRSTKTTVLFDLPGFLLRGPGDCGIRSVIFFCLIG